MQKLNPTQFEWTIWRNGTPLDIFGVAIRITTIAMIKSNIHKYAIGYCDGESLVCRPKTGHKAIMFYKDGQLYWFHVTNKEFGMIV